MTQHRREKEEQGKVKEEKKLLVRRLHGLREEQREWMGRRGNNDATRTGQITNEKT